MFTKDSGLVKVWVGLVMVGTYKLEQVPQANNLKEVVTEVINETIGDIAAVEPKAEEKPAVDLMAESQPAEAAIPTEMA